MKFWISGIVEEEVGDAFWQTMKTVQSHLTVLEIREDYGTAVKEMNVIFIISKDDIHEYRRFMKNAQSLEVRVRINYNDFLRSSGFIRIQMFEDALTTILQKTTTFNESQFNKEELARNIKELSSMTS